MKSSEKQIQTDIEEIQLKLEKQIELQEYQISLNLEVQMIRLEEIID